MNLMAIRSAMAQAIHVSTKLRCYDFFPSSPTVPCVVILPDDPLVEYHESMGLHNGLMKINLQVILMAGQADDRSGEATICAYLGTDAGSVPATFFPNAAGDPTLGGLVEDVIIQEAGQYGQMTVGGGVYATVRLKTEVMAR